MNENFARQDFDKAYRRGLWRKIGAWFKGKSNELLPYEEVRSQVPFGGQRDLGVQTVNLERIVGSVGRYRDFDRAFLPTQRVTLDRWVNISKARYEDKELPAIEVYKVGDVYFVKDGNHRVSVARERGQAFIDAYVTEIDIPIALTADMEIDDVLRKSEYAAFMQQTGLWRLRPDADLELSISNEYTRLLGHIGTHRYYYNIENQSDITYQEAVASWYDHVYLPLVEVISEHGLPKQLPQYTLTDLYLIVSEYQWLVREEADGQSVQAGVIQELSELYNEKEVRRILNYLRRANWISQMILEQERQEFLKWTHIEEIRPEADICLSLPGKYRNMLAHIGEHHYFLGLERQADVPYSEAVGSFYDNIYEPLLGLIDDQGAFASDFEERRTESDLVLWILDHRQDLVGALDTAPQPAADDETKE